jgi:hypothetical protein
MIKIKPIVILTCILCILFVCTTVFAEKQEWIDKTFDFKKTKRILIYPIQVPDAIKNGIIEKQIEETYWENAKLKNVELITFDKLIELIKNDTGVDLQELHKKDQKLSLEFLKTNLPNYVDLELHANIVAYGTGSEYKEGFSYSTTETQTSYVYGTNGSATVQTPVNRTHYVPGGNALVLYAGIRWDVYDSKTNKPVFSRVDNRSKMPTRFESSNPKNMYERILTAFFKDLNSKVGS